MAPGIIHSGEVKPDDTIALIDPDMFFMQPLHHDSFDEYDKVGR